MKKIFLAFLISISFCGMVSAQTNEPAPRETPDFEKLKPDEYYDLDGVIPSGYIIDRDGNRIGEAPGQVGDIGRRLEQGTIRLADLPIFIVRAIDLLSKLGVSIAVLALIYGGGQWMFGELLDTKDAAKKTIQYALMGLAVTFLSWLIVNIIKTQITGVDYFGQEVESAQIIE